MGTRRVVTQPRKLSLSARRYLLWNRQNGLCALCGLPLDLDETVVDHDHDHCNGSSSAACGNCDRGGIHQQCNTLLGMAGDSIEILEKAITYLKERDI